jgi:hypothetical protein
MMLHAYEALAAVCLVILGCDRWMIANVWRHPLRLARVAARAIYRARPYRGLYERSRYRSRHRDRSRLGSPQCPPMLVASEL